MQHPGFFARSPPLRLADLAHRLGAGLAPQANGESLIEDVRPLAEAQPRHLSFLDNRKYMPQLTATRAGACLIAPEFADRVPPGTVALALKAPYRGFAMALHLFYPDALQPKAAMAAAGEPLGAPQRRHCRRRAGGARCRHRPRSPIGRGTTVAAGALVGYRVVVGRGLLHRPQRQPDARHRRQPGDPARGRAHWPGWLWLCHGPARAPEGPADRPRAASTMTWKSAPIAVSTAGRSRTR